MQRRHFLAGAGGLAAAAWGLAPAIVRAQPSGPIRVGIAADLTGALSFTGGTFPKMAQLIADEINGAGGLLGRRLEVITEDTGTNEAISVTAARKLVEAHNVDVVIGGITSSARNAIADVVVGRGKRIYIYPMSSEAITCRPLLFATGATTAQQTSLLIPYVRSTGARRYALLGSNYIWPQTFNESARADILKAGGEVVVEQLFPLDQLEFGPVINSILSNKVDLVLSSVIPPGLAPLFKGLYESGYQKKGGRTACVFYDESLMTLTPPEEVEGLIGCADYFPAVGAAGDEATKGLVDAYARAFPGTLLTSSSGATGIFRGFKLWAAAVASAGTLDSAAVAAALRHGKLTEGPGTPAEVDPSFQRCAMKMYVAVARNGAFDVVSQSDGLRAPGSC
ncbi:ABC transporter substrate-binding protein [Chelatococcus asaccharovorans]|uniref:Amino acid/amide ABC transporter substrate-binding protein (HAAT family) n=1 Tax=Chelatococcus asaccharovorans TaxID=28210 RepID=A0A2V3U771_9HYPH|nr:ABC transporter substrate-binding protein [Chelatococcus asaccharovorans]MBS7706038.1 ABC transporter substrate-binding protein [Chelatococcus asaccharovorans]PXW59061.1 amino acid/amide ABC transporter substrate-binding protein (HAAT family) [Chelatococcus asaccharovorans]CAH1659654.1 Urea ABC transporter, urea binding protein [Chelatococcus asaccharovorans]CAH1684111.1 Urea ABC transporter, urea binding protein [Chelatococcus asaccharovorans]